MGSTRRDDHESVLFGELDSKVGHLSNNPLYKSKLRNDITEVSDFGSSCTRLKQAEEGSPTEISTQQDCCKSQTEENGRLSCSPWMPAVSTHKSGENTSETLWTAFGAKMSRLSLDRLLLEKDEPDEVSRP